MKKHKLTTTLAVTLAMMTTMVPSASFATQTAQTMVAMDADQALEAVNTATAAADFRQGFENFAQTIAVSPLEQVNQAKTTAEMRAAVENPGLDVDRWQYDLQDSDVKDKVADYLLAIRPSTGWSSTYDVSWNLDQAVNACKPFELAASLYYSNGDDADHVTQDLFFDDMTADGYPVEWTTDHPEVLQIMYNQQGRITRPYYQNGNVDVTLTATTMLGSKTYHLKVLARTTSTLQDVNAATSAYQMVFALGFNGYYQIDMTAYNNLPYPLTNHAADYFFAARPSIGFASMADVQTALDNAVNKVKGRTQELQEAVIGFAPGDTESGVTQNVILPKVTSQGTPITWTSTSPAVLDPNTGVVTRPDATAKDKWVYLNAVLDFGNNQTLSKSFSVYVLKQDSKTQQWLQSINTATTPESLQPLLLDPYYHINNANYNLLTDAQKLDAVAVVLNQRPSSGFKTVQDVQGALNKASDYVLAINSININYGQDPQHVAELSISYFTNKGGGFANWTSDHPEIFDVSQRVLHRPSYTTGPVTIHLTATLEFGFTTFTKTYELTVDPLPPTDQEATQIVSKALTLPNVTQDNLTLPTSGDFGTLITWSSSNPAVVEESGIVHRAHPTVGDQTATLTAHVTRNGVTQDRAFTVTVKAYEYTPLETAWITVVNNKHPHADDSVTVQNTHAGDVIKIYAEDGVTLIASQTAAGSTTTVSFANLGHKHTTIYVSNTRAGYVEHTLKVFFPSDNVNHPNL